MLESFSEKGSEVGTKNSDVGKPGFDPDRRLDTQDRPKETPFTEQRIDPDRRLDAQDRPKEISLTDGRIDPDKRLDTQTPKLMELSDDQKKMLKDLGMSSFDIENCKIDENDVFQLKTFNEKLEGQKHPVTGVEYQRKQVDINGIKIEGVFPKFESKFTCQLEKTNLQGSDEAQFKDCMGKLRDAIDKDPKFAEQFTERQREQIHDTSVSKISGYTWHHNEELGKMELVKEDIHGQSEHSGGKGIWGGGR